METISTRGSERATVDPCRIAVVDGTVHVTWQDVGKDGYQNLVASRDPGTGRWSDPVWLSTGVDNHARTVIVADHDGFLHAILGGHGTPIYSRSSLRPNDSSRWSEPEAICDNATYPVICCSRDNTLYLAMRGPGTTGVNLYARPQNGAWETRSRLIEKPAEYADFYAAYPPRLAVGQDGTIHALLSYYEGNESVGRGYHQAIGYACSRDGGRSWQRLDGSAVDVPTRPEGLDLFGRSARTRLEPTPSPELAPGGVVVDSAGVPYLFYTSHDEAPGRVVMATPEGSSWQHHALNGELDRRWPDMRAIGCMPSIRADDSICVLVHLTRFDERWKDGKPLRVVHMTADETVRLVWLVSADKGRSFAVEPLLGPGMSVNCPCVETTAGAGSIPADRLPGVLYFDGSRGYPGGGEYYDKPVVEVLAAGEFSQTNVILVGMDG